MPKFIKVTYDQWLGHVNVSHILYIEEPHSSQNTSYATLHLKDNHVLSTTMTVKELMEMLNDES